MEFVNFLLFMAAATLGIGLGVYVHPALGVCSAATIFLIMAMVNYLNPDRAEEKAIERVRRIMDGH